MPPVTLITGGAGFIGSGLSRRLVASGDEVIVLDILHPDIHPRPGRPRRLVDGVHLMPIDVRSPSSWDAVLKLVSPNRIVHLAAETGTGQSLAGASRHGSTNVVGTTEMLDALVRNQILPHHIVLASSRAVYGEGEWSSERGTFYPGQRTHAQLASGHWDPIGPGGAAATPLPSSAERTVPRPSSVYGATKLAQEHILAAWAGAMGVDLSVLRLQNVYGPGQSLTNSYTGIVTLFARLASGGAVLDVYEDGQILRDFVFIDDVVSALVACLERAPDGSRTIDIGSGSSTTILEVAQMVAQLQGAPPPEISGRFRDGDVRAASTDTGWAAVELGYHPSWDLEAGLKALFSWIQEMATDSPAVVRPTK